VKHFILRTLKILPHFPTAKANPLEVETVGETIHMKKPILQMPVVLLTDRHFNFTNPICAYNYSPDNKTSYEIPYILYSLTVFGIINVALHA
jgi:hypothetical protein